MLEDKVKALIRKYRAKCTSITLEDGRLLLRARETRSTATGLYDALRKLGLHPRSIVYGRWEFSLGNRYQEDNTDE